jgi:hypothetical protein
VFPAGSVIREGSVRLKSVGIGSIIILTGKCLLHQSGVGGGKEHDMKDVTIAGKAAPFGRRALQIGTSEDLEFQGRIYEQEDPSDKTL